VSADDAREQLEAVIWQNTGPYPDIDSICAILAAADTYAEAVADDRIAGRVNTSIGRKRLELATAEKFKARHR
jgi:hypothetical protein